MSKIGRKAIQTAGVAVEIKENSLHYRGKQGSGVYVLPKELQIVKEGEALLLRPVGDSAHFSGHIKALWGLHRALLAATIKGSQKLFERNIEIRGLGFKAVIQDASRMEFILGYSHKIFYTLPQGVFAAVDRTGQKIALTSARNDLVGFVASEICALRKTEPYKGTGIRLAGAKVRQKDGKTKK